MSSVTIFLNNKCYRINAGVAEIIFTETKALFDAQESESDDPGELFHYLNDWLAVGTINLDDLSVCDISTFHHHCLPARNAYLATADAKSKQKETVSHILHVWDDFLILLYDTKLNASGTV